VTKGKQWIRISKDVELLDTPGILWPKFEDQSVGMKLACIGSINDEILSKSELAVYFIKFLQKNYCNVLADRYNIDIDELSKMDESNISYYVLSKIAEVRGCIVKGGEPDIDKAAALLFDDFRSGRLGRISLEEYSDE
jgi:ribosome biogenesis GTPase A